MSSSPIRSNTAPSDASAERIKKFITTREAALKKIEAEIKTEQVKLNECNNAICNLEAAIPEAKQILKDHEDNLASILQISTRLQRLTTLGSLKMKTETSSVTLYEDFTECAATPITRSQDQFDDEAAALKSDVRKLWDKLRLMEMELDGWRFSHRLSTAVINNLTVSSESTADEIRSGKEAFRPIWRIPYHTWAAIFKHFIDDTISTYLKANNNRALRHPANSLSQVCHQWRYMVRHEPALRECFYVGPTTAWTPFEHDLAKAACTGTGKSITIITNLYQYFATNYNQNYRYDLAGSHIGVVPNQQTLLGDKDYNLLIDTFDDNSGYMTRMAYLPLRSPSSLTLSIRNPISQGYVFNYLASYYPGLKSLIIRNDNPAWFHHNSIGSLLPQLTTLKITVKRFPSFQLVGFLPATLEELHLRHDDDSPIPQLSQDVTLPKLHTLGISSLGSYLLDRLTANAIRALTLYGPSTVRYMPVSETAKAAESFRRIQDLKLQEWRQPNGSNPSFGAVAVLRDLATKMRLLRSVVFDSSWLDGEGLVSMVEAAMSDEGGGELRKLAEVTLDRPTGITREQCEALQGLIKVVNVYV